MRWSVVQKVTKFGLMTIPENYFQVPEKYLKNIYLDWILDFPFLVQSSSVLSLTSI